MIKKILLCTLLATSIATAAPLCDLTGSQTSCVVPKSDGIFWKIHTNQNQTFVCSDTLQSEATVGARTSAAHHINGASINDGDYTSVVLNNASFQVENGPVGKTTFIIIYPTLSSDTLTCNVTTE